MGDSQEKDSLRLHWKSLAACMLISMSPFQYGVDFTLISGFQAMVGFLKIFGEPAVNTSIGWNISYERQQLISSFMTLGAFVGSCSAGYMATYAGRKTSLYIAVLLIYVANIVMITTETICGAYAGRLIIGLGNGVLMTFSQLYIQECSPARYRGLMLGAFQFWTSFGCLLGTIVNNFTAKIDSKNSYIVPLGLIFIIPAFLCGVMFFIPESPRWLLQHDKAEEARKALVWLRPDQESVDKEMKDIQTTIELENNLMRCPSSSCHLGPHCWQDPHGKKHHALRSHHLKRLIAFVEKGNTLQSHEDVPEIFREELYMEQQQRLENQQSKKNNISGIPGNCPINIHFNGMQPSSQMQKPEVSATPALVSPPQAQVNEDFNIPGLRDVAVREYSAWHEANVTDDHLKAQFRQACDIALANGLDLQLIHEDQDPSFFIIQGIMVGITRQFIRDVVKWVRSVNIVPPIEATQVVF